MKKTVISILLAFLILSTTACSNTKPASDSSEESSLKHDETTLKSGDSMAAELAENKNDFVTAQYEIGDIILADGSMVKESDLTIWYWSASQAVSSDDYAWFVHYFNGYAGECPKNFTNVHALAVRVF